MINKKLIKILEEAKENKKLFKLTLHTMLLSEDRFNCSIYRASPELHYTIISIHKNKKSLPEQVIYAEDINLSIDITVILHRNINKWEQMSREYFTINTLNINGENIEIEFVVSPTEKEVKMNDIKLPAVMEVENSIGVWIKRIVLRINPNGSCIVVYGNPVENFEKHNIAPDSLAYFQECREIKEPTWRAYTLNEDITSLLGQTLRSKRHENILKICTGVDIESNEISMDDSSLNMEDAFKELEFCNEDNEWQPVGVLEA